MKNIKIIKSVIFPLAIIGAISLVSSCGVFTASKDTKVVAENRNAKNFENKDHSEDKSKLNDAQFLVNAAEINLEGIQLGKMAQRKGSTMHVKELGKMMEDEHTKFQKDLEALALNKNIAIPTSLTEKGKNAYEKLNEVPQDQFGQAYADLMVKEHKNGIDIYKKASKKSNDQEIKNWAKAILPELQTHLNHSLDCQKKCAKD